MRKKLTIGVIVTALAVTVSFVAAGPYQRVTAAEMLSASDILTSVRLLGLAPTTRVFRHGPYYVLHAIDPRGTELRVVADAALGDIVSVTPIFAPRFDAGPRIIHVPQPGERGDADDRDDEAAPPDDAIEQYVPPPRHRAIRRHSSRLQVPREPPRPRRNVLSVPPPPAQALSPSRPAPEISDKFDAKAEAEKFRAPEAQADRSRLPPPGYTAPPAPPAQD